MANEQNLHPSEYQLTREEAKKGGLASAEARRRKRDLRLALEMLLEKTYTDKKGNTATGTEAITAKLFEKAVNGDIRAFEVIRATVGQDPVQKIAVAEVDADVIDEVEKAVMGENGEKADN